MNKICKSCGETLPINSFGKSKLTKDGYENKCKKCRNIARLKYDNICVVCGTHFKSQKPKALYCSNNCKPQCRKQRVTVYCCVCGQPKLVTEKYSIAHEYFYCSKKCASIGEKGKHAGENSPLYSKESVICDFCGKEFYKVKSQIPKYKYHFCSKSCQASAYKELYKGTNNPCFGKERLDMRGENNWSWNPNRTHEQRVAERKEAQNKNWRRDVFVKYDYICQCCKKRGGNIVAHHIDSYDWCEEKRYDVNNGIVLCESCHKNFHLKYGYGKNTEKQFHEFMEKYANTELSGDESH